MVKQKKSQYKVSTFFGSWGQAFWLRKADRRTKYGWRIIAGTGRQAPNFTADELGRFFKGLK